MGKGELTHFEQFLLLSQYFQKSSAADVSTSGKGLNEENERITHVKIGLNRPWGLK